MLSFNDIYHTYYLRLVYFANKFLNDYQLSEEVVHDELLKLRNNLHRIESEKEAKGWLYICVANKCRGILDHKKYAKKTLLPPGKYAIEDFVYETSAEIWAQIVGELYIEIEKLSPQRKLIFKLSYLEDKPNEEISRITGLSMQTVSNSLYQALTILRIKCKVKDEPIKENKPRNYTLKGQLIKEFIQQHSGLNPKEIAAKFQVSLTTVYRYL